MKKKILTTGHLEAARLVYIQKNIADEFVEFNWTKILYVQGHFHRNNSFLFCTIFIIYIHLWSLLNVGNRIITCVDAVLFFFEPSKGIAQIHIGISTLSGNIYLKNSLTC